MILSGDEQAGLELCALFGLASAGMETRGRSDKQVEISRPALGFLLANRNRSTNGTQYEVWLQLLRGVSSGEK